MQRKARVHLAGRLELVRSGLSHLPGMSEGDVARMKHTQLTSFNGALDALVAVGAMTDDERHDWLNRMLVVLGMDPVEPLPPSRPGRAIIRNVGVRDPEASPPPPRPEVAGSLVRTIWGPSQSWAWAGGRFQILSVEVYEHSMSVTWRASPLVDVEIAGADDLATVAEETKGLPPDQREPLLELARRRIGHTVYQVQLADDCGTTYQPTSGGAGGGHDERRGHQGFWPAPPPEATRLFVTWQDEHLEIPLAPLG